jgi:hypothetical protein
MLGYPRTPPADAGVREFKYEVGSGSCVFVVPKK